MPPSGFTESALWDGLLLRCALGYFEKIVAIVIVFEKGREDKELGLRGAV